MKKSGGLYIFGEVLFDCFPDGSSVLGGAPFNVAWHLQALGDAPVLISRVGSDATGDSIFQAMRGWGMALEGVQVDPVHSTGRVEVTIDNGEPGYDIVADSAYDFISAEQLPGPLNGDILYHGTLCLRNMKSRSTLLEIIGTHDLRIFLDVNLRSPWWQRDVVLNWLKKAHWAKMNIHELQLLAGGDAEVRRQMAELQEACGLEQLIVTQGEQGSLVRTIGGRIHTRQPGKIHRIVDTVGAGDAFSALYIHGMRKGWPIDVTLDSAQEFAGKVIGLRGATTPDIAFYQQLNSSPAC